IPNSNKRVCTLQKNFSEFGHFNWRGNCNASEKENWARDAERTGARWSSFVQERVGARPETPSGCSASGPSVSGRLPTSHCSTRWEPGQAPTCRSTGPTSAGGSSSRRSFPSVSGSGQGTRVAAGSLNMAVLLQQHLLDAVVRLVDRRDTQVQLRGHLGG